MNEMNAWEWQYLEPPAEATHLFDEANELVDEFNEVFFDGEFEDQVIDEAIKTDELTAFSSDIFVGILTNVIRRLQTLGVFSKPDFAPDVLVGVQITDPEPIEVLTCERVSKEVNSAAWHQKVVSNGELLRGVSWKLPPIAYPLSP